MKVTLDIDDTLLRAAKAFAARCGMTLDDLVAQCLQMQLKAGMGTSRAKRLRKLPVSPCTGGLWPGIDPACNASMLDAADKA